MDNPAMALTQKVCRIFHLIVLLSAGLMIISQARAVNILMEHYDLSRSGVNTAETTLTPANVNATTFGRLFTIPVDGPVYAQPLYLENFAIAGGVHNVLFVCTEKNTVYALDADTGETYWSTNLGTPFKTTCYVFSSPVGITGTPVIDPDSSTLYLDSRLESAVHMLHALDLATGAEKFGGPAMITATGFDTAVQHQRPGLVLNNGVVYIGYGSLCDSGDYHGFVLGYNATNLTQVCAFNDTPTGTQGGIWASGMAPPVDADGNIYISTGNGSFDGINNFGSSYVKLNSNLEVEDYATPTNWASLNSLDLDVASGGPILLPPHFLLGMSKDGTIYLMDANNLGHVGNFLQVIPTGARGDTLGRSPLYWQGPDTQYLFFAHGNNRTMAYTFNGTNIVTPPFGLGAWKQDNNCGGIALSANGNTNGILWEVGSDGLLRAYDAVNFPKVLWSSRLGITYMKMNPPIVANGKVYVSTVGSLIVWGLVDNGKPKLTITSPKTGQSCSNTIVFNVTGKVNQMTPVTNVFYSVNGGVWTPADSDNDWDDWGAAAGLVPGTNTISAYAIDNLGSVSATNTVKLFYLQTTTATITTNGNGTITPNYNGKPLIIGKDYSVTAHAGRGFAFTRWTDGDEDSLTTNSRLNFEMASNLTFIADFTDATRPTLHITFPLNNSKISASNNVAITGTASDNVGVTGVFCSVNHGGWQNITTTNGFKTWTTPTMLIGTLGSPILLGSNVVSAYATDAAGHCSATNIIKFTGIAP